MKTKHLKILSFFILITIFSGCRTFVLEEYIDKSPLKEKLAPVIQEVKYSSPEKTEEELSQKIFANFDKVKIGMSTKDVLSLIPIIISIDDAIVRDRYYHIHYIYQFSDGKLSRWEYTRETSTLGFVIKSDRHIENVFNSITKNEMNNICLSSKDSIYGRLFINLNKIESHYNYIWLVPYFGTLFIGSFLGCPNGSHHTAIELDILLKDISNQTIYNYKISTFGSSYKAMYWGYKSDDDLERVSFLNALEEAYSKFKYDFASKIGELNKKLLKDF